MAVLASLPVLGAGNPQAESFYSIFIRTANTYNVKPKRLYELVMGVQNAAISKLKPNEHLRSLNGFSNTTEILVTGLERLTGNTCYRNHTFLKVRNVFARNHSGFFSETGKWCSRCIDPENIDVRELMISSLRGTYCCPIHNLALQSKCPVCFALQHFAWRCPGSRHCMKCGAALWKACEKASFSESAEWRDAQLRELVSFVSDPSSSDVSHDWSKKLRVGLDNLVASQRRRGELYTFREWSWIIEFKQALPLVLPRLENLLRLASIQAVSLTQLIISPEENCSPRLLPLEEMATEHRSRRSRPEDKWILAAEVLRSLSESDSFLPLPSATALARSLDLLPSGMRQHFPDQCRAYTILRRERAKKMADEEYLKVCAVADEYCRSMYGRDEHLYVRSGGAEIALRTGCSKHLAEAAMHVAMRNFT